MTVIDEVLQAEKTAAHTIAEAKTEAAQAVVHARAAHEELLQAESEKLQVAELAELSAHEKAVEQKAKAITDAVARDVSAIENTFAQKAAEIKAKIKQSLS